MKYIVQKIIIPFLLVGIFYGAVIMFFSRLNKLAIKHTEPVKDSITVKPVIQSSDSLVVIAPGSKLTVMPAPRIKKKKITKWSEVTFTTTPSFTDTMPVLGLEMYMQNGMPSYLIYDRQNSKMYLQQIGDSLFIADTMGSIYVLIDIIKNQAANRFKRHTLYIDSATRSRIDSFSIR